MPNYVIFQDDGTNSGPIVRSGACSEDVLPVKIARLPPGQKLLVGDGRDDTHEVVDGQIVPLEASP